MRVGVLSAELSQQLLHRPLALLPSLAEAAAVLRAVQVEREEDLLHLAPPLAQLIWEPALRVGQVGGGDVDLQRHGWSLAHPASRYQQLAQQLGHAPGLDAGVVAQLAARSCARGQLGASLWALEQPTQAFCQRATVAVGYEHADATTVQEVGDTPYAGAEHRRSARHRLEHGPRRGVPLGR